MKLLNKTLDFQTGNYYQNRFFFLLYHFKLINTQIPVAAFGDQIHIYYGWQLIGALIHRKPCAFRFGIVAMVITIHTLAVKEYAYSYKLL